MPGCTCGTGRCLDVKSDNLMKEPKQKYGRIIALGLSLCILSCQHHSELPRVFYINSYHPGYGSSDDITAGIEEVLEGKVDLEIHYLDSKRNPESVLIEQNMNNLLDRVSEFDPDVIIASDDNAVKYVIEPFYKKGDIPIIFCGVNWDATMYQLPPANVTGMLEILPVSESLKVLRDTYPQMEKIAVISENTTSEMKNHEALKPIFSKANLSAEYTLVDEFEEWTDAIVQANSRSDIIYLPTNCSISNWDREKAIKLIRNKVDIPVFSCDDFMMPYAVFGLTKVAKEQGEWAAEACLKVLNGVPVREIKWTSNSKFEYWFNKANAERIGFEPP